MSGDGRAGYVRAGTAAEAVKLLEWPGAVCMAGGTDVVGQVDARIIEPKLLVDISHAGFSGIRAVDGGLVLGAGVTLAALARSELAQPYAAVARAASSAASALVRNVGTVGGNLCQATRCWYLRGPEWNCWLQGGDICHAAAGDHRKHGLQPGACISAHPSDLAPALAACGARVVVASAEGERDLDLLALYRRPTNDQRSFLTLTQGEIVTEVHLPAAPEASAYERLGERQAFSFPLVAVAAARRDGAITVVATGVANIPVLIDLDDPLADLPGNPQTKWKRRALETLTERAVTAVG